MGLGLPKSLTQCRRFFLEAHTAQQRTYEALRAYFVEGRPSHAVARAFGYSPGAFRVMCHQFRRERAPAFFVAPQRGPRTQPKKSTARATIIALRKQNYSVYDISEALKERQLPLSPTAVGEVLKREGFAPLPRRRDEDRPARPRPVPPGRGAACRVGEGPYLPPAVH
jgi:transposase